MALVDVVTAWADKHVAELSKEDYCREIEGLFVIACDLFHNRAGDWEGNHQPEPLPEENPQ